MADLGPPSAGISPGRFSERVLTVDAGADLQKLTRALKDSDVTEENLSARKQIIAVFVH